MSWNYYPDDDPTSKYQPATAAEVVPDDNETLQCWATPLAMRDMPYTSATRCPCSKPGTGRLGMCEPHAAEFIDGVATDEPAPTPDEVRARLAAVGLPPMLAMLAVQHEDDAA